MGFLHSSFLSDKFQWVKIGALTTYSKEKILDFLFLDFIPYSFNHLPFIGGCLLPVLFLLHFYFSYDKLFTSFIPM